MQAAILFAIGSAGSRAAGRGRDMYEGCEGSRQRQRQVWVEVYLKRVCGSLRVGRTHDVGKISGRACGPSLASLKTV